MARQSDARAALIDTGARLFQRQGCHASGLTQILTESGAPKGSFYHHFPAGKEELAEAAWILARATQTTAPFEVAADMVAALVAS